MLTRPDVLRYANCWEDAHVLCSALDPAPDRRILSIASGGDNSFALAAGGAEVVAADLSAAQIACVELKRAALRRLEHPEVLGFFGITSAADRRATYARLEPDLTDFARAYWTARPTAIGRGFVHAGKFERYFAIFRRFVLPLIHRRSAIRALLQERGRGEREEFYAEVWDNRRWRALFRVFFSRFVMARLGRDREFFRQVEGRVAERIMSRARRGLTLLPTHSNPFLDYIVTGSFRHAVPRYLEPDRFEAVRDGLDRLTLVAGSVDEAARKHAGGGFDGFNLSDIFEYLTEPDGRELYAELLRHARPGARLAYWNMLVPRRFGDALPNRIIAHGERARALYERDLAFFYGAFILEEVR